MAIELDFVPANYDHLNCCTKEDHPELFKLEIKRPPDDFFTYKELIEFLQLSPAIFVSCLRQHRHIINIYSDTLTKQDRDWFYDYSVDTMGCLYAFHDALFHYVEVRELRHALVAEKQNLGESGVHMYLGEIWEGPLKNDLREGSTALQTELALKTARIAELEQQLADTTSQPQAAAPALQPQVISGLLALLSWWLALGENSQQKKHGITEGEIKGYFPDMSRNAVREIKKALPDAGIKVWAQSGARPST